MDESEDVSRDEKFRAGKELVSLLIMRKMHYLRLFGANFCLRIFPTQIQHLSSSF